MSSLKDGWLPRAPKTPAFKGSLISRDDDDQTYTTPATTNVSAVDSKRAHAQYGSLACSPHSLDFTQHSLLFPTSMPR